MFELKIGADGAADKGMDILQFLAAIIGSLAWPVTVCAVAFLFRPQIEGLLKKLRKVTWGDKSADFSGELDKAEQAVREVREEGDQEEFIPPLPNESFQQILTISPSAAIMYAWTPLERRLLDIASSYKDPNELNPTGKRPVNSPGFALEILRKNKVISGSTSNAIKTLLNLRNLAAHGEEVSAVDAARFNELAELVTNELGSYRQVHDQTAQ